MARPPSAPADAEARLAFAAQYTADLARLAEAARRLPSCSHLPPIWLRQRPADVESHRQVQRRLRELLGRRRR